MLYGCVCCASNLLTFNDRFLTYCTKNKTFPLHDNEDSMIHHIAIGGQFNHSLHRCFLEIDSLKKRRGWNCLLLLWVLLYGVWASSKHKHNEGADDNDGGDDGSR